MHGEFHADRPRNAKVSGTLPKSVSVTQKDWRTIYLVPETFFFYFSGDMRES